jgi:hypothetical protein
MKASFAAKRSIDSITYTHATTISLESAIVK